MRALLDVNVLIALLDADHSLHAAATRWFDDHDARFVTFDGAVALAAVRGAKSKHLFVL